MGKLCNICESRLEKNAVGLNKKLFGRRLNKYYCMNCLSAHIDMSVEDLLCQIEDFKLQGCELFE